MFREDEMKTTLTWVAGSAFLAMTAMSAQADCAAELARLTGGETASEGISKDGSLAPLEGSSDGASATDSATETAADAGMNSAAPAASGEASADAEGIAKDGSHAPLEGDSGQQAGIAMSGADAQAQQEGQPTATEQATAAATNGGSTEASSDASTREAHIQAARDALAAGDEDTCMKAVQAAGSA
ncbi:hypothetical protein GCM10017322_13610 [Paracoccus aerius]|nr:hypothetical protein GCM10017322_13610 [Paracoccus aerius]